jgi:hypothetical protein
MKKLIINVIAFAFGSFLYGQNFAHFTGSSTGEILTASGSAMSDGFVLSYGTFTTLNESSLASAITGSSPFAAEEFDAVFGDYTELGSTTFDIDGDITIGTTSATAGSKIYFWAFDSTTVPATASALSQLALYGPITIPSLGTVLYNINNAVTNGDILIGSSDASNNLLLATVTAVPEPSTYAALLGALALGFVAYRRRRS